MKLTLRTFFIAFFRFFALMAVAIFSQQFEVSPLPAWTMTAFVFLMHFFLTFLFARWVFKKYRPTVREGAVVAVAFIIFELVFEHAFVLLMTRGNWASVWSGFAVLPILVYSAIYAAAVALAGYVVRKKHDQETAIEGLVV